MRDQKILLATLAIIATLAMLASTLAPRYFAPPRAQTRLAPNCKSNLKNLGTALEMYSADSSGRFPITLAHLTPNYLKSLPTCPAAGRDTYSRAYTISTRPDAYTIVCEGHFHANLDVPANFPQYDSIRGLIDR